jgi:nucleoside-diphosphate-sugar epimerase
MLVKVLVTGGTGFLGSHVVRWLLAAPGVEVTLLVRPSSNLWRLQSWSVPGSDAVTDLRRALAERVCVAVADVCAAGDMDAIIRRDRPEVLIHLAALVHHTHGSGGGPHVYAVNLDAAVNMHASFLACGGRRFITAGSCFEYGPQEDTVLNEATPCRPIYDYAVSKAKATEAVLAKAEETATEALVLRVFAPYGPLEDPARIVPQLLSAGLTGTSLGVSAGGQVRDYIFVEDVATAFVAATLLPRLPRVQAIYNVSTGAGHSLRQLAGAVERVLGRPLHLRWGERPYRPNELMCLIGDNRLIANELGWRPVHDLDAGLRQTLAWSRPASVAA